MIVPRSRWAHPADVISAPTDAAGCRRSPYLSIALSVNATEVSFASECFNEQIYKFLRETANPLRHGELDLYSRAGPLGQTQRPERAAIIISASGMCKRPNPPSSEEPHWIAHQHDLVHRPLRGTHLGARFFRAETVNIFGEPHRVQARIASIDSFSGHADKHNSSVTSAADR